MSKELEALIADKYCDKTRNIAIRLHMGLTSYMGAAQEIREAYMKGYYTFAEAEYLLENLKSLKKEGGKLYEYVQV